MSLESHTKPGSLAGSQLVFPSVLVAVACVAYANSFAGVFLFDDIIRIVNEERIRRLWPIGPLLSGERPVVDLSLAINYAMSELRPWSYHAFNLAVHVLAGLTLFGIVRRSIARTVKFKVQSSKREVGHPGSDLSYCIAFVVALLFLIHPLQTQSVTYIIQRGESMMGLFYLLTLYCAIRAVDSPRRGLWHLAAIACCALGMGTKAVMVTAPLMVILYDWVFVGRGDNSRPKFKVQKRRLALYVGLCATWLVLWLVGIAPEVLGSSTKGSHVGLSYKGMGPWQYAATQPGVIFKYLQLALWPSPLCLDYDWPLAITWRQIVPPAIIVIALLSVTFGLLWKRHWLGFVGVWFFLILAPTSSIVPIKDLIFEHRMYLPLAAVITAIVIPTAIGLSRFIENRSRLAAVIALLGIAPAVPLAFATHLRNRDYHGELSMWQDVIAKQPGNPRGHVGVGVELLEAGRAEEAIASLRKALSLKYAYADAHYNLAIALAATGRHAEAVEEFVQTTNLDPARADAWIGAAQAQSKLGHYEDAAKMVLNAIQIQPKNAEHHYHLGNMLADGGDLDGAMGAFLTALSLNPDHHLARINLGNIYLRQNQLSNAQAEFEYVLGREPDQSTAMVNLGRTFLQQEQWGRAVDMFSRVPQGDPLEAEAHFGAGWAWSQMNQSDRARQFYRKALQIDPEHVDAAAELARLDSLPK